jgi:Glycosyl hydrolase family 76
MRSRAIIVGLAVLGVLAIAACGVPAPALRASEGAPLASDRNAERARATLAMIEQHFQTGDDRYVEVFPSPGDAGYTTLWPLTQQVAGMLFAAHLPNQQRALDGIADFEPYWDSGPSPPGYSATMLPPFGTGNRKFFDDNAWVGLDLLEVYRSTGNAAALVRAREIFNFTASGWDSTSSHPYPGGVWWSQQNPNPRFAHRNTISTASSAELAAQLFEVTGRSDDDYLNWAVQMYAWVDTYLRGSNGLYGDHVDLAGQVDPGQLTYNQGTMIGAGVLLYRITGDPAYRARAAATADTSLDVFGPDFSQPPAYNAVFFRNLLLLEAETGDSRYRAAMQTYADQVWDALRDPTTGMFNFAYGRNRSIEPHRLVDQAAMLQIYALLALGPNAADVTI